METIRAEEISQIISKQIKDYEKKLDISETGSRSATASPACTAWTMSRRVRWWSSPAASWEWC